MPAMTNILVKDDAAAPKEFTLVPITDTPDAAYRANDSATPLEGQIRLTVSAIRKVKSGQYLLSAKLEVPVMETLGASGTSAGYVAPPKVAYVNTIIITMFADSRSTLADRANSLKLAIGVVQGASATTATGILANTAAGDAWKNSVLPITSYFTQMVTPN